MSTLRFKTVDEYEKADMKALHQADKVFIAGYLVKNRAGITPYSVEQVRKLIKN